MVSSRVGELLVAEGKITSEQLGQALSKIEQDKTQALPTAIVELGLVEESELADLLAKQFGVEVVTLTDVELEKEIISLIPQDIARKHQIIPIKVEDGQMTVAMVDPSDIAVLNDIKFITGYDIKIRITTKSEISSLLEKTYEEAIEYDALFEDFDDGDMEVLGGEDDITIDELEKATEDAPVVKLVNAILSDAVKKNCSDIHIEPYEKSFRVRFRIDGVLYEIMQPPIKLKNAITSRLKIMADLDIAERRLPQDGRIKMKLGPNKEMDFRVSVLPELFGEKVVLRLLDKGNLQTDMTKLGFSEEQMKAFMDAISKPYGMVLVTGPTGSGKTTTLYSALSELNETTVNIATAEDPVEFNLHGINQVQMKDDIGLNFAAALRSFLRQDPDIIMVGEIRDYETAEIAIKAALTGHLVLSTLHTNDAPATINRLLNMGVEPFLVASSINIVVAQRLARRICSECKEELKVNPEALVDVGIPAAEAKNLTVYHGKGCSKCSNTGYKGRVALYETMTMTETLKEFILNGASTAELKRQAISEGMSSLRMSGLKFLKDGVTTVEEVLRVTVGDD